MPEETKAQKPGPAVEQKATDADFLIEEFDIPVDEAGELLADEAADADEVRDAAWHKRQAHDPLAGVPVPRSPGRAFPSANDDMMQKNVLHTRKNRP